jgi:hypothetical protein
LFVKSVFGIILILNLLLPLYFTLTLYQIGSGAVGSVIRGAVEGFVGGREVKDCCKLLKINF